MASTYLSHRPDAVHDIRRQVDEQNVQGLKYKLYGNIMHDPRVRRGNTWSMFNWHGPLNPSPKGGKGRNGGHNALAGGDTGHETDPVKLRKRAENERRKAARLRAERLQQLGPPPVPGRRHSIIQTDLYLEELAAVADEQVVECQTDAFLDRPPTPIFMPAKTGADAATQILDGDLFDFDVEVKPILEILIGRVTEQALMEVLQEEELASVRAQQRAYEEIRNAELAEQQRLEEEELRRVEEKDRRKVQEISLEEKRRDLKSKIAAQAFAKNFLEDLVPGVFEKLTDDGYFYDPIERETERQFVPWLLEKVELNLLQSDAAELILQEMIKEVVEERILSYAGLLKNPALVGEPPSKEAEKSSSATVDDNQQQQQPKTAGSSRKNSSGGIAEPTVKFAADVPNPDDSATEEEPQNLEQPQQPPPTTENTAEPSDTEGSAPPGDTTAAVVSDVDEERDKE